MIRTILLACAASAAAAFAGHAGCGDGAPPRHPCLSAAPAQAETTVDGRRGAVAAGDGRRRALLLGTAVLPAAWASRAGPSRAAAKVRPDDAYASLVAARRELQVAGDTYLAKKDWDGLRAYLRDEAANMNGYEASAQTLLESKRLDAESKRDIGTIRRYGVGADVIIMYGGLRAELDEDNETTPREEKVASYLLRSKQSLDEVLAICRSNGFS